MFNLWKSQDLLLEIYVVSMWIIHMRFNRAALYQNHKCIKFCANLQRWKVWNTNDEKLYASLKIAKLWTEAEAEAPEHI